MVDSNRKTTDKLTLILKVLESAFSTIRYLVKYAFWIILVLSVASVLRELAGTDTNIGVGLNFFIELWSDFELGCKVAWGVGLLGIFYGLLHSRLRKRAIKYLHKRIKKLETTIDEERSSSGLTEKGETPREDKL